MVIFRFQVPPDVHHGELFLRADLAGRSLSQRPVHPPSRQTEAQTRAQLRAGETPRHCNAVQVCLKAHSFFIFHAVKTKM